MTKLKVLSYWNLNNIEYDTVTSEQMLKVLSYWNLNIKSLKKEGIRNLT